MISGAIRSRDVVRHGAFIVREFGAAAYLRCCMALLMRRKTTFLDCVCQIDASRATRPPELRS